jgi:hypothetical protein
MGLPFFTALLVASSFGLLAQAQSNWGNATETTSGFPPVSSAFGVFLSSHAESATV